MDLVMPVLDGAEATRRIMAQGPCPILLVTSSVSGNFNLVYRAMGYGGLDAVNTPTLGPDRSVRDGESILARLAKLDRAQQAPPVGLSPALAGSGAPAPFERQLPAVVALGASTGGPEALAQLLRSFPVRFPAAVVVVQHIAAAFAPGLARWLEGQGRLPVRPARDGDELRPGEALLAATDDHLVMRSDRRLTYAPEPADYPYRPSVDVFFHSLASAWSRPGVAVLLTGMGSDGALGLLRLRRLGWHTIAQDQASCIVYGMPKAAAEHQAACQVLPLNQIADAVLGRTPSFQDPGGVRGSHRR